MRCYLAATLIAGVFLAATGKVIAQSPKPQSEIDSKLAQSRPDVLCERTEFGDDVFIGGLAFTFNREVTPDDRKKAQPESRYSLSSVTVPAGGWKVDAIAIYTSPSQPAGWRKVGRARLNVIAKKRDLPGEADDPRKGREVEVTVREAQKGVYEVRAADLKLTLEPGEYWIGLTPICSQSNGFASHLIAQVIDRYRIGTIIDLNGLDSNDPDQLAEVAAAQAKGVRRFCFPLRGNGTGHIERYADAVEILVNSERDGIPVLVHCSAGAQRTGACISFYRLLVRRDRPESVYEDLGRYGWDAASDQVLVEYINSHMRDMAELLVQKHVLDHVPAEIPQLHP